MRARRATTALLALALACVAIVVPVCGDEDDSEPAGPDPATLVPPDALLYAEAEVRPGDDEREDLEGALEGLLGVEDAGAAIREQVDSALAEGEAGLTYEEDVEPWLGERLGAFFLNFGAESDGALVIPTTDEAAARAALDELVESEGKTRERSLDGIAYTVGADDSAVAIVDDFALVGSESGVKAAVGASSGDSLADSEDFDAATEDRPEGAVVTAYTELAGLLDALVKSGEIAAADAAGARAFAGDALDAPVVAAFGANADDLFAELDAPILAGGDGDRQSELLERIPEDAWAAIGLPDAGDALARSGGRSSGTGILDRLGTDAGLDLEAVAESVGDGAAYIAGESVLGMGGAVLLEVTDEPAVADALDALERRLARSPDVNVESGSQEDEAFTLTPAQAPIAFPFVLQDDLLVAALGQGSVDQVLAPESSLSDSGAYDAARDALGDDYGLLALFDFEPMVKFLQGLPNASTDADIRTVLPYLDRLDLFAIGASEAALRFELRVDGGGE